MSRKYVYGLLALPVFVALVALAIIPGETRATFFTEFRHRTLLMLGFDPEEFAEDELGPSSQDMGISEKEWNEDDDDVSVTETDAWQESPDDAAEQDSSEENEDEPSNVESDGEPESDADAATDSDADSSNP